MPLQPPHQVPDASAALTLYLVFFILALPFVDWSSPLPRLRRKPEGYWRRAAMGFVVVLAFQHISVMFRGEQSAWGPAANLALLGVIFWALDTAKLPSRMRRDHGEAEEMYHNGDSRYSGGVSDRIFEGHGFEEKTSFSEKFGDNFGPGDRESFTGSGRQRKATSSFSEHVFESFRSGAGFFDDSREEEDGAVPPPASAGPSWDAYAALGLADGAPDSEVRARYRQLAKEYHPDMNRHLDEHEQRAKHERMLEVQRAYEELTKQAVG